MNFYAGLVFFYNNFLKNDFIAIFYIRYWRETTSKLLFCFPLELIIKKLCLYCSNKIQNFISNFQFLIFYKSFNKTVKIQSLSFSRCYPYLIFDKLRSRHFIHLIELFLSLVTYVTVCYFLRSKSFQVVVSGFLTGIYDLLQ